MSRPIVKRMTPGRRVSPTTVLAAGPRIGHGRVNENSMNTAPAGIGGPDPCQSGFRKTPRQQGPKPPLGSRKLTPGSGLRMKPRPQPKVGIFWVFRRRLLMAACPVEDGVECSGAIDSRHDHVDYWKVLQRRHPELRALEYEQVPRGRVVFFQSDQRFCVYLDERLRTPALQQRVRKAFDLPASRTRFESDPHYVTDRGELDRLFGNPS